MNDLSNLKMRRILVVCPTSIDKRELKKFSSDYDFIFHGNDVSWNIDKFDALQYIDEVLNRFKHERIHGVISTEDYPHSIIGNIVAKGLNLPHVEPDKLILCQHKYYCRKIQKELVPEAVPMFALINQKELKKIGMDFPFFIKPVKSFFSMHSNKVNNEKELKDSIKEAEKHLAVFVKPFNQILKNYTNLEIDGSYMLAEELLVGRQVTLECFIYKNKFELIGIVDSIMYPGTNSFQRFEYPSSLPEKVQQRMYRITEKLMTGIGFDNGIFNIEMFYNPKTDDINIVEVNPRLCQQFADLMEKVNGTNTYGIQIALSLGDKPKTKNNSGDYKVAASFVLREFKDGKATKVPIESQIERLTKKFPDARLDLFIQEKGTVLSEYLGKGESYVYARINLGGKDKENLFKKFEEAKKYLTYEFSEIN